MDKNELMVYKSKLGYNLGQLELDYYHHKILKFLYVKYNTLYFKGGTCLQKCYGLKRFSEDLDFNFVDIDLDELIDYLIKNIDEEVVISDKHSTKFGTSFVLRIKGILFNGQDNSICKVSLDFRKEDVGLESKKLIIRPVYHDLDNYFLLAMNTDEILAEKVRAVMTRFKARDIFDLVELLHQGVKVDMGLVNKKLSTYNMSFDVEVFLEKVMEKKEIYENEISSLTNIYSSFDESYEFIKEILTNQ